MVISEIHCGVLSLYCLSAKRVFTTHLLVKLKDMSFYANVTAIIGSSLLSARFFL